MEIDQQSLADIKILLEEGVDDYWWTIEENYELINSLRTLVRLPVISREDLKERRQYWHDL